MKKKVFIRPVSLALSTEMFEKISEITNQKEISLSEYIRNALIQALNNENNKEKEN